jgi:hypothetical protein
MFENLIRVLRPLGTFRGGDNAAVSDDADDQEQAMTAPNRSTERVFSPKIRDPTPYGDRTPGRQKSKAAVQKMVSSFH